MNEEEQNIIYTDYEHVHQEIWKIHENWISFFPAYITVGENKLAVSRWALTFISVTKNSYDKFKDKLNGEDVNGKSQDRIKIVLEIYKELITKGQTTRDNYILINEFIETYLFVTDMSNIVKQKDNINKSILKNR